MDVSDYKGDELLSGWAWYGLGLSAAFHVAVFTLAASFSWVMPSKEASLQLCTVNLLTLEETEMEAGGGDAAPKGNGESEPAAAVQSASAEPEEVSPPEPEKTNVVHVPEKMETPPPVVKPVAKPKEKPKVKPRPSPKPGNVREMTAKSESAGAVDAAVEGSVGGSGGEGTEGGSGSGGSGGVSGASHGPVAASFGSGDGPSFLSRAQPNYPRLARELGKEGAVLLRLTIDERGGLTAVEVMKAAGSGFDEEAVRCIKSSRFSPAKRDGRPVACHAMATIRFVLKHRQEE